MNLIDYNGTGKNVIKNLHLFWNSSRPDSEHEMAYIHSYTIVPNTFYGTFLEQFQNIKCSTSVLEQFQTCFRTGNVH